MVEFHVAVATRYDGTKTQQGWVVEQKSTRVAPFPVSILFKFRNEALAEMRRLEALAAKPLDAEGALMLLATDYTDFTVEGQSSIV